MDTNRRFWLAAETVHAVTYFAPESIAAADDVGFQGFWMGYFGFRAAPLGPVGAGLVQATFYNFHPARVLRAVPDCWDYVDPDEALVARARSAAAALRRAAPECDGLASGVTDALAPLIRGADPAGRPLFAANRALRRPGDPVADLWQLVTDLREHRGDGHVAALRVADIDGCECHVLQAVRSQVPAELYQTARGWTEADWTAAGDRLTTRGLLAGDTLTAPGRQLVAELEATTDRLAGRLLAPLATSEADRLLGALELLASQVRAAGDIRFPNPIGLPTAPAEWAVG